MMLQRVVYLCLGFRRLIAVVRIDTNTWAFRNVMHFCDNLFDIYCVVFRHLLNFLKHCT